MKRTMNIHIVLALGFGLTLALLWLLGNVTPSPAAHAADPPRPAGSPGDVYCVAQDGGSYVGCTQVFTNVQAAVDAASGGETIKVATGVYTDTSVRPRNDVMTIGVVTQVVYISKTVTIQGGYITTNWTTPYPITQPTILDAQGQGRVLYITGNISPTIEGFRITGGNARELGGCIVSIHDDDCGGGVYIITATATLGNNWVFSNTVPYRYGASYGGYGGGLALFGGVSTLGNNTFFDNIAGAIGGGLYLYSSTITLYGNSIISNTADIDGGGAFLDSSHAVFVNNNISNNLVTTRGYDGGGLCLFSSDVQLDNNTITSNSAGVVGGGLFLIVSNAVLTNNVVADNRANIGGGFYIDGSTVRLLHTTIARNSGGDGSGVYAEYGSTVALTNTIIVSQTVGITVTADSRAVVNGVLWFDNGANTGGPGTITVTHEITGDPAFIDGYHILSDSMAYNAGVDAGVHTDIDNQPRPYQAPDLGADEYWPPGTPKYAYLPLVLHQSP